MKYLITTILLTTCSTFCTAAPPVVSAKEKKVTVDPARYEKTIANFEKQDQVSPPEENGLLFVGSSSIRMWDLKKSFPMQNAINRGFGGSHISDSVHFAKRIVLKYKPKAIIFYAGDNDIAKGKIPAQVVNDFRDFVAIVHKQLPATKILYVCIKPSIARWKLAEPMQKVNHQIEAICKENKQLVYVDVWKPMLNDEGKPCADLFKKDGLHMNDTGYAIWNKLVIQGLGE